MIAGMVMALLLGAAPVYAGSADIDAAQRASLEAASTALTSGQPQRALDTIEPVIKAYQADLASEKRRIYCGMSGAQTLGYMGLAASATVDAVAFSSSYCDALYIKGFALIDLQRVAEARHL